jgi:hypothetical protein
MANLITLFYHIQKNLNKQKAVNRIIESFLNSRGMGHLKKSSNGNNDDEYKDDGDKYNHNDHVTTQRAAVNFYSSKIKSHFFTFF